MAAAHSFQAPCRPIDFSPYQLQPRVALSLAISGMIGWVDDHIMPPWDLVSKEGVGLALVLGQIRYTGFPPPGSWGGIEVTATAEILQDGAFIDTSVTLATTGGTVVAEIHLDGRWVRSEDGEISCATPGTLPARLLRPLPPECVSGRSPGNPLPRQLARIRHTGELLGETQYRTRVFRQSCEVADQWSSIDIPLFAACSREQLALDQGRQTRSLRLGLSRPVQAIDFSLSRPFYFGDRLHVSTKAYRVPTGVTFVHHFTSDDGAPHGIVTETTLDQADDVDSGRGTAGST